jgi:hypothetical protein
VCTDKIHLSDPQAEAPPTPIAEITRPTNHSPVPRWQPQPNVELAVIAGVEIYLRKLPAEASQGLGLYRNDDHWNEPH